MDTIPAKMRPPHAYVTPGSSQDKSDAVRRKSIGCLGSGPGSAALRCSGRTRAAVRCGEGAGGRMGVSGTVAARNPFAVLMEGGSASIVGAVSATSATGETCLEGVSAEGAGVGDAGAVSAADGAAAGVFLPRPPPPVFPGAEVPAVAVVPASSLAQALLSSVQVTVHCTSPWVNPRDAQVTPAWSVPSHSSPFSCTLFPQKDTAPTGCV